MKKFVLGLIVICFSIVVLSACKTASNTTAISVVNLDDNSIIQGNINNGGFVCESDKWAVYINAYSGLVYKVNKNTGSKTILRGIWNPKYLNIVGDWIYFSNSMDKDTIYKIKIDGTQLTKLNDDKSSYIHVVGEWVYYIGAPENKRTNVYRIKVDGTDKQKLNDETTDCITVSNGWIYIGADYLYKSKIDDLGNKIKITDAWSRKIIVKDDWIYYLYKDKLHKVRADGSAVEQMGKDYTDYIQTFIVIKDWIYYVTSRNKYGDYEVNTLYKMKIDGTNKEKLFGEWNEINYLEGSIYGRFRSSGEIYERVLSLKPDGSGQLDLFDQAANEETIDYKKISKTLENVKKQGVNDKNRELEQLSKNINDYTTGYGEILANNICDIDNDKLNELILIYSKVEQGRVGKFMSLLKWSEDGVSPVSKADVFAKSINNVGDRIEIEVADVITGNNKEVFIKRGLEWPDFDLYTFENNNFAIVDRAKLGLDSAQGIRLIVSDAEVIVSIMHRVATGYLRITRHKWDGTRFVEINKFYEDTRSKYQSGVESLERLRVTQ